MSTVADWLVAHADLDRVDRDALLGAATGLTRAQLLARPERTVPRAALGRLADWADRRPGSALSVELVSFEPKFSPRNFVVVGWPERVAST